MPNYVINIIVEGKDRASGALHSVKGALGGIATVAGGMLAANLFGNLAGGIRDVVGSSLALSRDLEAQMSGVQAVMGVTDQELMQLKELVTDLGIDPNLKVSSSEAAEAIDMLGRNGLTATDILNGAAKATVLLANSTGGEFAQSADIATDVMSLWNIQAQDMMAAVNGITSVVSASKFSVDDYALALAQGGGVAASVGVEFDDFNTAIAGIAPLFASGSDAGTSFKTLLQTLPGKSGPARDALAELGIITEDGSNKFFDAEGNLRSMAEIAGVLAEGIKGLSEEQISQAFATAFGTDAMRAAFGMAQLGEEGFRELQQTMAKTDAVDAAATRMDNLSGSMEIFQGILETIKIRVGDTINPLVRSLVDGLAGFVSAHGDQVVGFFDNLVQGIGNLIGAFQAGGVSGVVEALGLGPEATELVQNILADISALFAFIRDQVLPTLGEIAGNVMPLLTQAMGFVNEHWEAFRNALIAVGAVLAGAAIAAGIAGIVSAIAAMANPITLVIGAVALLAAAWTEDWLGIRTTLTEFWETTGRPIMEQVVAWLQVNIPIAIQFLSDVWQTVLLPAIQVVGQFITNTLIPILSTLAEWAGKLLVVELKGLGVAFETLLAIITGVWDFVSNYLIPLFEAVANLMSAILGLAVRVLAGLFENVLLPAMSQVWSFIERSLIPIFNTLKDLLDGPVGAAMRVFKGIVDGIADAFESVKEAIEWVIDKLEDLTDAIGNIELPGWLMPGSPTPLELGLRGIADALHDVNLTMGQGPLMGGGLSAAAGATTNYYFNQTIHTRATSDETRRGFETMRALVGA